jgi:hypothetical protein
MRYSDERGGGQALFINRTFAEYCTARRLSRIFELSRSVMEHVLFYPKYSLVRVMFDRNLVTNCPLHSAVLEQDMG